MLFIDKLAHFPIIDGRNKESGSGGLLIDKVKVMNCQYKVVQLENGNIFAFYEKIQNWPYYLMGIIFVQQTIIIVLSVLAIALSLKI